MSQYWSPVVRSLTPYVPGEQPKLPNLVKLNTNENPYGPSARTLDAIRAENDDRLRLYPDPNSDRLRHAIAHFHAAHDIVPAQVFVGNGSDEVLAHAFLGLLRHERDGQRLPLLFPDITYSFYPVYCDLYGIVARTVPLREDFSIAVEDYLDGEAGGIIFPNPNAPTGRLLPLDQIERLATARRDLVLVIDEAYIDFAGDEIPSAIALINGHPNILVIQTLSKSRSLAGLRVGFAVGPAPLIEALDRVKNSFNSYPLDRAAIAGASVAFEDVAHFNATRRAVMASRNALVGDLTSLGFDVVPSAANFVFARHPKQDAASLAAALRERGIIVRHFRQPRIEQYLRITVGTNAHCAALTAALRSILGGA